MRIELAIALAQEESGPALMLKGYRIEESPVGDQMTELNSNEVLAFALKAVYLANLNSHKAMAIIAHGLEAHHGDLALAEGPKSQVVMAKA